MESTDRTTHSASRDATSFRNHRETLVYNLQVQDDDPPVGGEESSVCRQGDIGYRFGLSAWRKQKNSKHLD